MRKNKILIKLKNQNKKTLMFSQNTFRDYVFRLIGVYISIIFIKCRFHPTTINILNFLVGLSALILIFINNENLKYSIALFQIAYFIDLTDGNVARYNNIASFWGRFLDSVIDILVGGFIYVVLFYYSLLNFNSSSLIVLGMFATLFHPIYHMIYDKYSSLARWSNLDNKTKIVPYIRLIKGKKINSTLLDFEFLLLISLLFVTNKSAIFYIIYTFFVVGVLKFFFNLCLHLIYSRKYMANSQNQNRNV